MKEENIKPECGCIACKSGMKTGHTVFNQMIENQKSMNNGQLLNIKPEWERQFDEKFSGIARVFELEWQEESQFGCSLKDFVDDEIKSFIHNLLSQRDKELEEKVKSWLYSYDNYRTMMATNKGFERGVLARELAEEVLRVIKQ